MTLTLTLSTQFVVVFEFESELETIVSVPVVVTVGTTGTAIAKEFPIEESIDDKDEDDEFRDVCNEDSNEDEDVVDGDDEDVVDADDADDDDDTADEPLPRGRQEGRALHHRHARLARDGRAGLPSARVHHAAHGGAAHLRAAAQERGGGVKASADLHRPRHW